MNRRVPSIVAPRALLLLMLTLLSLSLTTPAMATPFVHESIQTGLGVAAGDCAIAIDSKGQPHVSYGDITGGRVRYAHRSGGVWIIETVQTTGTQDWWTSLELDAADAPRISYASSMNITYASKSGGVWTVETVIGAGAGDHYTSLALDSAGNPHISYRNSLVELWHAAKAGGAWTVQRVDATGGNRSSIVVDHDGNPRIASIDNPTSGNLEYASKTGGVWTVETVIASATSSSLVLDSEGRPHISAFKTVTDELAYFTKVSGTWTAGEIVEAFAANTTALTSIALSQAALPRIAYGDPATGDLKYAARSSSAWAVETVALVNGSIFWSALSLERQDNPIVCFFDISDNTVKVSDSAIRSVSPSGGGTWPVGSAQAVRWAGSGAVSILLSADGGVTFSTLRSSVTSSPYTLRVPHTPTRFAVLMVSRSSPLSTAVSDSFFTIDATIALAKFDATRDADGDGTRLTWETRPGPEADIRYRVERAGDGTAFTSIADGLDHGEFVDPSPMASSRYRLIAINGLGEEYVLGETSVTGALAADRDIVASPNPASGPIEILYRVPFDRPMDLTVYDLSGRRVRSLVSGRLPVGVQSVMWDRRDETGRDIAAGTYFARLTSGEGFQAVERVTIVR